MKKPFVLGIFAALALGLPCTGQTGNTGPTADNAAVQNHRKLVQDGNLPETASALPLLSTIGAGVLLGGLVSARKTRSQG